MKDFPQQATSQLAQNHELVKLYLDIGQCRYIHHLLSKELADMHQHGREFCDKNDALLQLLHQFQACAYPASSKPLHVDDSLDAYINSISQQDINALLSAVYIPGVLSHE